MASTGTITHPTEAPPTDAPVSSAIESASLNQPDRFDQIFGHLRGTVTVIGDIVTSDPELWEDPE